MHNKIVLITGGNSGIGKATAEILTGMGATVIIACRNQASGELAAAAIAAKTSGAGGIHVLPLDLASLDAVRNSALLFEEQWPRLDVLINNAGIYTSSFQSTRDGFEMQFGVNHLGHYLLTRLLTPALRKADDPRVVNVSSLAYLTGKLDFNRLREWPGRYNGMQAYAQSKLANVLFTREMARHFPDIDCNALHPGVVRTDIATKHAGPIVGLAWKLYTMFRLSPEQGAATSVYLASASAVSGVSGRFFDEQQQARRIAPNALSDTVSQRLWSESEQWVRHWL